VKSSQTKGLIYALLGFASLTIGDATIKSIAGAWPGTAVAALRYALGAIGLFAILLLKEGRAGFTMPMPRVQIGRGFVVATATVCFFIALFLMPLAEATSITFTAPMLTGLISAVVLKERISRTQWLCTLVAFAGVLIVLRPNLANLGAAALLPLVSAFCMAWMLIFNRMVAGTASLLTLQFLISAIGAVFLIGFAALGHFSGVASLVITVPDWTVVARCMIVAVTATAAHSLLFLATTHASAATVAPMSYSQLILALVIGVFAFGDVPDAMALVGAALIVGSGLFLWWKQKPV
jgi:drug/metabolite transporter (DMT)-like permease